MKSKSITFHPCPMCFIETCDPVCPDCAALGISDSTATEAMREPLPVRAAMALLIFAGVMAAATVIAAIGFSLATLTNW